MLSAKLPQRRMGRNSVEKIKTHHLAMTPELPTFSRPLSNCVHFISDKLVHGFLSKWQATLLSPKSSLMPRGLVIVLKERWDLMESRLLLFHQPSRGGQCPSFCTFQGESPSLKRKVLAAHISRCFCICAMVWSVSRSNFIRSNICQREK